MKFEAHITFLPEYAEQLKEADDGNRYWKFSQIHGDPDLGDRLFCYLSAHDADEGYLRMRTIDMVKALRAFGIPAIRAKVEQIVFDERYDS